MIDKFEVVTVAKLLFTIEVLLSHVTIENMLKIVNNRESVVCNRSIAMYNRKNVACKIPIDKLLVTVIIYNRKSVFSRLGFTNSKAHKNTCFLLFKIVFVLKLNVCFSMCFH